MQIRKVEQYTVFQASPVFELDPEKFRKLSLPYTGNSEQEFVDYIAKIFPWDIPKDLDEESKNTLQELNESIMIEYSNSLDNGVNEALQVGEIDLEYRNSGGFRVEAEAK